MCKIKKGKKEEVIFGDNISKCKRGDIITTRDDSKKVRFIKYTILHRSVFHKEANKQLDLRTMVSAQIIDVISGYLYVKTLDNNVRIVIMDKGVKYSSRLPQGSLIWIPSNIKSLVKM
jgi:hypothetical protein